MKLRFGVHLLLIMTVLIGGAMVAMIIAWSLFRKPDWTMTLNGALASLVEISANWDQATQINALIGVVSVLITILLLDKLRSDEPVGRFPVYGICGVWVAIAAGIQGTSISEGLNLAGYILVQAKITAIICVWAFIIMGTVFCALRSLGMHHVSAQEKQVGLYVSEHRMHGYPPPMRIVMELRPRLEQHSRSATDHLVANLG